MKPSSIRIAVLLLMGLAGVAPDIFAQQTQSLSGTVMDAETGEPLQGVSIFVKDKTAGTSTDELGAFTIRVEEPLPVTLVFSMIGYATREVEVRNEGTAIRVELQQEAILGKEIVIAASRVEESILESPVSIEQMSPAAIREVPTPSFYDAITNLKGVESSVQSLTFRSITTRGFNSNGNVRFNQFMDGMDNQAPGLNFSVGNVLGMSELDVESVELLPGAASALYGAGGMNGTLLMRSKNPFDYQGLSVQLRAGINHVNNPAQSSSGFVPDITARYAKAFNDKVAFKVNVSYLQADDWQASDYANIDRLRLEGKPGFSHADDPNYDGINIYGDEINVNMQQVADNVLNVATQQFIAAYREQTGGMDPSQEQINTFLASDPQTQPFYVGLQNNLIPDQNVSRTGYMEKDLVDYEVKSLRTSAALHYRFTDNLEGIAQAHWGEGTSVYTGADRYSLRNFNMGQYKLELRGDRFFLRAYTTQERSGEAYNATALGSIMNETWKASQQWFPQYTGVFVGARINGLDETQAHAAARAAADEGRYEPGSGEFNQAKESITERYIGFGEGRNGAKFNDRTNLYHYEGMYDFSELTQVVEVQAGAHFRRFALNSDGTIFDDADQRIKIDEYGGFLQAGKRLLEDRIKLTGSVRYDKNENFEGRFTPRLSGVFTVAPDHHVRLSWQTGFRNPTTQDQYIDLLVRANTRLIGGLPSSLEKYDLYDNRGYTQESVQRFGQTGDPADLEQHTFETFKPERVQAYEIGYKGLFENRLLVDAYYYYNAYRDFISVLVLLQSPDGSPAGLANPNIFSTVVNNPGRVVTQGWALGLDYVTGNWRLTGNTSFNTITEEAEGLYNQFNTPKYRVNLGVGNRNVYENIGFNITWRWQDKFQWNSTFAVGEIPAFSTLDAQVSYTIPAAKATVKLGGSNILNKYYRTSYGNPSIGALYYLAVTFDSLLQ